MAIACPMRLAHTYGYKLMTTLHNKNMRRYEYAEAVEDALSIERILVYKGADQAGVFIDGAGI